MDKIEKKFGSMSEWDAVNEIYEIELEVKEFEEKVSKRLTDLRFKIQGML